MFVVLLCKVLVAVGEIVPQYLFKLLVDIVSEGIPNAEALQRLWSIVSILAALYIGQYVVRRIMEFVNIYFQTAVKKDCADTVFAALHSHCHDFFLSRHTGSLVKQSNRYVDSFENIADHITFYFLPTMVHFSIGIVLLWTIHPLFGGLFLAWSIVFMTIVFGLTKRKAPYDIRSAESWSSVSGYLADTISNQLAVRLSGHASAEQKSFSDLTHSTRSAERASWIFGTKINAIQGAMMIFFEIGLLILFVQLFAKGMLTAGDFVMLFGIVYYLFGNLWEMGNVLKRFYNDASEAMEMVDILDQRPCVTDAHHAEKLQVMRGEIALQNVTFHYGDATNAAITDLNLTVAPGEKVALVGHSGSGKSTLMKLLLRLYDVTDGSITIDGTNIAEVKQYSLRRQISLVPQEPILFHRTIAENIGYGRLDASRDEIKEAAMLAHAHDFIVNLPNGYDTLVGERGVKLSGGERQRVAIARAIIADAPILVLDEATSALDSVSESCIQESLEYLMEGRTSIVIAHRLSTIKKVDRIIVLEHGRIIEEGSHEALLQIEGGVYRGMFALQAGGFI